MTCDLLPFFTVVTLIFFASLSLLQSPPYAMIRESAKKLSGNDAFEGYAIDLIREVADVLSKYTIPPKSHFKDEGY